MGLFGLAMGASLANAWEATLEWNDAGSDPSTFPIQLKKSTVPIVLPTPTPGKAPSTEPPRYLTTWEATLIQPNVTLFQKTKPLATSGETPVDFTLQVPLTAETTEVQLSMVDARGAIKKFTGTVTIQDWHTLNPQPEGRKWAIIPALGYALYRYTESTVGTLTISGIVAKVSASYRLGERFDASVSGSLTVLPLTNTDSSRTTRFLGVNARLGYKLPFLKSPWAFYIKGGYYFTTMWVSPADHGFSNMNGPQIYPVLTRVLGKGLGHVYLKYSPVATLDLLANREIAAGLGYHFAVKPGQTVSIELDVANIGFTALDQLGSTRTTDVWSFSLTGGYRF